MGPSPPDLQSLPPCGSVDYSAELDLLAVTEGERVVLRSTSGCEIARSPDGLAWPHDAVLLPAPMGNRGPRSGLVEEATGTGQP